MALKVSQLDPITNAQIDKTTDLVPIFDVSDNELKKTPVNNLPSAGVSSFNGRTGPVSPQQGDYSISQIAATGTQGQVPVLDSQGKLRMGNIESSATAGNVSVDHPMGTAIPQGVTNAQNGLELLYDTRTQVYCSGSTMILTGGIVTTVQVVLQLNGAKSDVITIYDSSNAVVGTCNFISGQTYGLCQIVVPSGGGVYKFRSAVSKSIPDGVSAFEKTVTLTDAAIQTVNVYPDVYALCYWFGNNIREMQKHSAHVGSVTFYTNFMRLSSQSGQDCFIHTNEPVPHPAGGWHSSVGGCCIFKNHNSSRAIFSYSYSTPGTNSNASNDFASGDGIIRQQTFTSSASHDMHDMYMQIWLDQNGAIDIYALLQE